MWRRRARPGAAAVLAALLWCGANVCQAGTVPPVDLGPPLILRLEGVLEPTADGARAAGNDVVSMQVLGGKDATVWYLGRTDARMVGGDNALFGKDVLQMVAPFSPNFLLTGPPALLERFRQLAPHRRVVLEGLVTRGGRTYYLRKVEAADVGETGARPPLNGRGRATRSASRPVRATYRA